MLVDIPSDRRLQLIEPIPRNHASPRGAKMSIYGSKILLKTIEKLILSTATIFRQVHQTNHKATLSPNLEHIIHSANSRW
jgi:hypothetical protein